MDTIQFGSTTYVGEIGKGELNGFGHEYYKGKLLYEGQFRNTERHGQGKSFNHSLIEEGIWRNGQFAEGTLHATQSGRNL